MENIDKMIEIYKALSNCTTHEEAQSLKTKHKASCNRVSNSSGELLVKKQELEGNNWFRNFQWKNNGFTSREQMSRGSMLPVVEQLGKDVEKLMVEVKELVTQGGFHEGLTFDEPDEQALELLTRNYVGRNFGINMDKIWECLMRSEVAIIGVWGMGGVGKTTLVEHIYNKVLKNEDLCGSAYWVTVSKDCTIRKLQSDISRRVDIRLFEDLSNEDDELIRAAKLARYFKIKKKFVLFLDDMWNYVDLERVGIHKEKGYRLILTTRELSVCHKMVCNNVIEVIPLKEEEAWHLFVKSTGYGVPPRMENIAKKLAMECAGLPLGIITIARSMANCDDIGEWKSVLKKLQSSKVGREDMEEYVFKVLRLSFDRLKDSRLQECLLHCANYPEDQIIPIYELVWAFIDHRLIDEMETMEEVINEGHLIVRTLQRACLLSKSGDDHLKMHDLIRDMALQIAGSRFMVKAKVGLKDFPSEEEWKENHQVASLMENDILGQIQISPKCPKLSILLLQHCLQLRSIIDSFFEQLLGLTVLNLSHTGIKILPSSISNLKNLAVLLLRKCESLMHVPSLAELKALKRLDLFGTEITEVPKGLEKLINLWYLNLKAKNLKTLPTEVFGKLIRLQYLVIYWDSTMAVKVRLMNLRRLETFEGGLYDIDDLNELVKLKEMHGILTNYVIQVGANCDLMYLRTHIVNRFDR